MNNCGLNGSNNILIRPSISKWQTYMNLLNNYGFRTSRWLSLPAGLLVEKHYVIILFERRNPMCPYALEINLLHYGKVECT